MFPWARAVIFSHQNKLPLIAPSWSHVRTGVLRKGGVDLYNYCRKILLWDTFKKNHKDVAGFKKFYLTCFSIKLMESSAAECDVGDGGVSCLKRLRHSKGPITIVFKGDGDYFLRLNPWREFLLQHLRSITLDKWVKFADSYDDLPIVMNIRTGKDFPELRTPEDCLKGPVRTPLNWFVATVKTIRKELKRPVKAYIVSEGTSSALKEVLKLSNVELINSASPICDLFIAAKAKILLASGSSSFSAWASFLGQSLTLCYPNQNLAWFKRADTKNYLVRDFNPEKPCFETLKRVGNILEK